MPRRYTTAAECLVVHKIKKWFLWRVLPDYIVRWISSLYVSYRALKGVLRCEWVNLSEWVNCWLHILVSMSDSTAALALGLWDLGTNILTHPGQVHNSLMKRPNCELGGGDISGLRGGTRGTEMEGKGSEGRGAKVGESGIDLLGSRVVCVCHAGKKCLAWTRMSG